MDRINSSPERVLAPVKSTSKLSRRALLARSTAVMAGGVLVACASPNRAADPSPTAAPVSTPTQAFLEPLPTATAGPAATPSLEVTATPAASPTVVPTVGQFRAYWVDAFHPGFKSPAEVDRLLQDARSGGVNAVIVELRRRADVYFNKSSEPRAEDPDLAPGFDALQYLLDQGHASNPPVQVHVWGPTFPIWLKELNGVAWGDPKDPNHVYNLHGPNQTGRDNWLCWDNAGHQSGGGSYTLDPGHPDAADYVARVFLDIVKNYPVDGIHLDYIRYADHTWGYNPVSVARFNQQHGRTGTPDPSDAAWSDWRRSQVASVVRRIFLGINQIRPSTQLSAALIPWGYAPTDDASYQASAPYYRTFQDWKAWLAEGIVDFGVPMDYVRANDPKYKAAYAGWASFGIANQGRRKVVVGAGIFENALNDSIGQIERALGIGSPGIALYSYATFSLNASDTRAQFQQLLTGGPFQSPVAPLGLPWKGEEAHVLGTVLGADGKPVDGATVSLKGLQTRAAITDGSGIFGAVALPPGNYQIQARAGQQTGTAKLVVEAGKVAHVSVKLSGGVT